MLLSEIGSYTPKLIRGRSGCGILWQIIYSSDRFIGLLFPRTLSYSLCISRVVVVVQTSFVKQWIPWNLFSSLPVIFAGDFSADPGHLGGPLGHNPNEQGSILGWYLSSWDYVSVHLHT